jgi:hypothetical protein
LLLDDQNGRAAFLNDGHDTTRHCSSATIVPGNVAPEWPIAASSMARFGMRMLEIRLRWRPAAAASSKLYTQADSYRQILLGRLLPGRSSLENDPFGIDTLARLAGRSEAVRAGEPNHVAFASGHLVGEALEEAA